MAHGEKKPVTSEPGVAAVAFIDLAGYTALTEAHGDLDATEIASHFYELTESGLQGSTELVKTIGDAVMIAAPSAEDVLLSVVAIIKRASAQPLFPALRSGLHYGPVVQRSRDYYGATVNVAARVTSHARAGQALCTESFAQAIGSSEVAELVAAGHAKFKNVSTPIALREILPHTDSATAEVIDPICRMRVQPASAQGRLVQNDHVYYFCSLECVRRFLTPEDSITE